MFGIIPTQDEVSIHPKPSLIPHTHAEPVYVDTVGTLVVLHHTLPRGIGQAVHAHVLLLYWSGRAAKYNHMVKQPTAHVAVYHSMAVVASMENGFMDIYNFARRWRYKRIPTATERR
jgi:hypothetical protein